MIRRRKLVWSGAVSVLLAILGAWFLHDVLDARLGSQSELDGLAAPDGLDWDEPASVDSFLVSLATAFVERPANAGIVIGVTRGGRRHVVARGLRARSDPAAAVDASTTFELGSVTKTFTGTALAQAVLAGRVSLDEPIGDLLPRTPTLPDDVRSIPLEAVATHSAGFPSDPPSVSFLSRTFRRNPFAAVTNEVAFQSLARMEAPDAGGSAYRYSNFGFMVLGHLLEEATGTPYAELIEEGIARPLGMSSTWVRPPASQLGQLAVGHRVGKAVEHWYSIPLAGASGVVSSVPDLLTYLEANLHPESSPLGEALRLAQEPRTRASETVEVGLGWHVYTVPGVPRIVYHNGSTMGFRSYVGMAPELDLGVVVLGNSRDPTINAVGRLIMRTLAGIEG